MFVPESVYQSLTHLKENMSVSKRCWASQHRYSMWPLSLKILSAIERTYHKTYVIHSAINIYLKHLPKSKHNFQLTGYRKDMTNQA